MYVHFRRAYTYEPCVSYTYTHRVCCWHIVCVADTSCVLLTHRVCCWHIVCVADTSCVLLTDVSMWEIPACPSETWVVRHESCLIGMRHESCLIYVPICHVSDGHADIWCMVHMSLYVMSQMDMPIYGVWCMVSHRHLRHQMPMRHDSCLRWAWHHMIYGVWCLIGMWDIPIPMRHDSDDMDDITHPCVCMPCDAYTYVHLRHTYTYMTYIYLYTLRHISAICLNVYRS